MTVTRLTGQQVGDGTITDADVAAANKDGLATTACMRTLGTGAQQAMPGNTAVVGKYYHAISGLQFTWASTSSIAVSSGFVPDTTRTVNIETLASTTVSTGSTGLGGMDVKTLTGTVTSIGGGPAVPIQGTGTAFLTEFGLRALTGTITSSGTTVTGTGTKFLTEVIVGDLIGSSTKGYYRVTAIASNTSLTISKIPGSAFSGQAPNAIERPIIKASSTVCRIDYITSDTNLQTIDNPPVVSGVTATAGSFYAGDGANNSFLFIFAVVSSGTAGIVFSTQSTTPLGSYSAYKLIGYVLLDTAGNILLFTSSGGARREIRYMVNINSNNLRVLPAGAATTQTTVKCGGAVPRITSQIILRAVSAGANALSAFLRPSNLPGTPPTGGPEVIQQSSGSGYTDKDLYIDCDGQQQIDYINSTTGGGLYLDVLGGVFNVP